MTTDPAARPPLDEARLAANPHLVPDLTFEVHDELGSTNALAAERARSGAAEGLVVVAEHQTAGRGRLDRVWTTPARSTLTFSLLLRPTAPTRTWPWLPLLAGYAVNKALRAGGFAAGVKWPNDVLIGDRKVAGILVERVDTDTGPAAVLGIGINSSIPEDELPVPEATSLLVESGQAPDRTDLLVQVLSSIAEAYGAWQVGGDAAGMRLADVVHGGLPHPGPRGARRAARRRHAGGPCGRDRPRRTAGGPDRRQARGGGRRRRPARAHHRTVR